MFTYWVLCDPSQTEPIVICKNKETAKKKAIEYLETYVLNNENNLKELERTYEQSFLTGRFYVTDIIYVYEVNLAEE